ncbi:MAG TPA: hypothetical protein VFN67_27415 [Polyangiales bacterium]|nr:hypothetical protein [Polyangiales bacterium]
MRHPLNASEQSTPLTAADRSLRALEALSSLRVNMDDNSGFT